MENDATLSLTYITEDKEKIKFPYDQFFIEDNEYKIKEKLLININFNDFEKEMGSKVVTSKFIDIDNKQAEFSYFEVISGENHGFLFSSRSCFTRDLIFPDNLSHYFIVKSKNNNILYQGNFTKRLLLINISSELIISIDNIIITKSLFTISTDESSQIVAYDLKNGIYFYKQISPINYKKFFDFYDLRKDEAEQFVKSIYNLIKSTDIKNLEYDTIKKKINNDDLLSLFLLKFNVPKSIITKYYNKKEYFEFVSNCSLYYILYNLKDRINNCQLVASIFTFFEDYKTQIKNDTNLNYYNKCIVILEFSYWIKNLEKIDKFEAIQFTYFTQEDCDDNSPLKSSLLFLKNFIETLDNESPFLEPLIIIESGTYIYNSNISYGYGLISKKISKNHLMNIIPELIFLYKDKNSSDNIALSNKASGAFSINLGSQFFSQYNQISLNKKVDNIIIRNNLSLKLVLILWQEVFSYKKGKFSSSEDLINSPKILFHRGKNTIINLVNKYSFEKGENYINIIRDPYSCSRNFFEYFFGECEYGYISELIEIMLENGVDLHFLFNISLWNENIKILQEFTKLKYLVYLYNPKLLPNSNFKNIDEEILEIKNIIIKNNIPTTIKQKIIPIKQTTNKEESPILENSNSILSRKYSDILEYKDYEKLSFDSLQKKLKDPNISDELKNMIREILFSRIIKH